MANLRKNTGYITDRFIKKLKGCISMNFSKIRIKEKKNDKVTELYNQVRDLKDRTDQKSRDELEKARTIIADTANENFKIIKAEIDSLKPKEKLCSNRLWKLKKKLCPNSTNPPTAMLDKSGNLLISDKAIEERALEAYK